MPVPDTIELPDLPAIIHAGRPVITTELLAAAFQVSVDQIHDNFRKTSDRFITGIHFHKLEGADLRAFKDRPENYRSVEKQARSLMLWTERGAARHAKMLNNDTAWAVFDKLETAYFEKAQAAPPTVPASKRVPFTTARREFEALRRFAKDLGLDDNQAVLRASKGIERAYGVDLMSAIGTPLLEAPHQELLCTVMEIGMRLGGVSARDTNRLLIEHGFQRSSRDHHGDLHYEATDLGRPHSRLVDQDKARGDGAPVQQLRWLTSVVDPLKAAQASGSAAL